MKTYFSLLDVVRFLAAFWVVNFHYFLGLGLSKELSWYRYGNLGVQLFFIVSGFVIVQSLYGKSFRDFALGRFIRLFPLFWILCTATYVITLIVPGANNLKFSEYLASMTMLGDVFSGIVGYGRLIDPSYWTLTVELIFYVGIGIFVLFFSYKSIRYFFGLWLLFSIAAFYYNVDQNFFVKLMLVRHAAYFIFGGSLALIATAQAKHLYEKYIDWTLLVGSAFFATYIHQRSLSAYLSENVLDTSVITILHIVFFLAVPVLVYLSRYAKDRRYIKTFMILGGVTYPLYLLHQTIGVTIINYVTNTYGITRNLFTIVFEVFIIVVAYLVYVQDKKMRAFLQKKLVTG